MFASKRTGAIAGAFVAAAMLAGCTQTSVDMGTFRSVPEDRGRVVLDTRPYQQTEPTRVSFQDFQQRSEYALYRNQQGQAETFFAEVREENQRNLALEYEELVASTVGMWRFNQGHALAFDSSVSVETDMGGMWMQTYRQTNTGRQCVGFSAKWDIQQDDPKLRPAKVLFGYHCVPRGESLNQEAARDFVRSIEVRGITVPLRIKTAYDLRQGEPPAPGKREQAEQLVIAQDGVAGGVSGLPDFPVWMARPYRNYDKPCANC